MSEENKKTEAKPAKGFTLLFDDDGNIELRPINLSNKFELIGAIEVAGSFKHQLADSLTNGPQQTTLRILGDLVTANQDLVKATQRAQS